MVYHFSKKNAATGTRSPTKKLVTSFSDDSSFSSISAAADPPGETQRRTYQKTPANRDNRRSSNMSEYSQPRYDDGRNHSSRGSRERKYYSRSNNMNYGREHRRSDERRLNESSEFSGGRRDKYRDDNIRHGGSSYERKHQSRQNSKSYSNQPRRKDVRRIPEESRYEVDSANESRTSYGRSSSDRLGLKHESRFDNDQYREAHYRDSFFPPCLASSASSVHSSTSTISTCTMNRPPGERMSRVKSYSNYYAPEKSTSRSNSGRAKNRFKSCYTLDTNSILDSEAGSYKLVPTSDLVSTMTVPPPVVVPEEKAKPNEKKKDGFLSMLGFDKEEDDKKSVSKRSMSTWTTKRTTRENASVKAPAPVDAAKDSAAEDTTTGINTDDKKVVETPKVHESRLIKSHKIEDIQSDDCCSTLCIGFYNSDFGKKFTKMILP